MSPLRLEEPAFLLLFGVVAVLLWWHLRGDRYRRTAGLGRSITLTVVILALSRPVWVDHRIDADLVIAVDRSASMTDARLDELLSRTAALLDAASGASDIRWVALGARVGRGRGVPSLEDLPAAAPVEHGTSLGTLLDLAAVTSDLEVPGQILLLTDAVDTASRREELLELAQGLRTEGVAVHPLLAGSDNAAGITSIEVRDEVEVTIVVEAAAITAATLRLSVGGDIRERQLTLNAGPNEIVERLDPPADLRVLLSAEIEVAGDPWPEDDRRQAWLLSTPDGRVLLTGPRADRVSALLETEHDIVDDWPEELDAGDVLVALSPQLPRWPRGRPDQVRRWVRDHGGHLVVTGGPLGFGHDADWMAPLNRALPVQLPSQSDVPPLAIVYVVDRSGSMGHSRKADLAVSAVAASAERLDPRAMVGVMAFSDQTAWMVSMRRADAPTEIREKLANLTVYGGTDIYRAISDASEALVDTDARTKHIILLTDGKGTTRLDNNRGMIRGAVEQGVSISTVAVSRDAARGELAAVAQLGRGRTYYTETFADLPRVVLEETLNVMQTNALGKTIAVEPLEDSPLLGGIDWRGAPSLGGFNQLRARPAASVGLEVAADTRYPLLASWRYGLGTVTVFSSELGGTWGSGLLSWRHTGRWLDGLVEHLRSRAGHPEATLSLDWATRRLSLVTFDDAGHPRQELTLRAFLSASGGKTAEVELSESAPGHYTAALPWSDRAVLATVAVPPGPAAPGGMVWTQGAPPVPDELRALTPDPQLASRLARITAGTVDPTPQVLTAGASLARETSMPLWPWLAWLAAVGLLGDVALRRFAASLTRRETDIPRGT